MPEGVLQTLSTAFAQHLSRLTWAHDRLKLRLYIEELRWISGSSAGKGGHLSFEFRELAELRGDRRHCASKLR